MTEHDAAGEHGYVDDGGTVWVRTAGGDRAVGSWQGEDPQEGLDHFAGRFAGLETQVGLLEQRLRGGKLSPNDARRSARRLREEVAEAHAVGDLDGLARRLEEFEGAVDRRTEEVAAERAQVKAEVTAAKERMVAEAETVADSSSWKASGDRLKALLEEWKAAPRLDRQSDDALWKRLRTARTTFDRRRSAHFAEVDRRLQESRERKEQLAAEAESLADSTEWAPTAARFRELMTEWKAAGAAPRAAEETLWRRFRTAQDTFFAARSATFSARDAAQRDNQAAKEALATEAEALLPVSDVRAAQTALRRIQDRWAAVGHVPRAAQPTLEGRLRQVEQAVAAAGQSQWQRRNPGAVSRAEDTVAQLEDGVRRLVEQAAQARAAGDNERAARAEESLAARQALLDQARRTLADLRGG